MKYLIGLSLVFSLAALILSLGNYQLPVGGLLSPGGSGFLSPLSGLQKEGNSIKPIENDDALSIGTSSPPLGVDLSIDNNGGATTTLYITSTSNGVRGGCIQIEATGSTTLSMYATTTGIAYWFAGPCR